MSRITTRPVFWAAFALLSAVSAVLAWRYFPEALPLINLDVRMSREQALEEAGVIAERLHLAPPDAQRAVIFAHDGQTQNYVELEGGGKSAFTRLLSGEVYSPFTWEVRLFRPRETAEAHVRFRPDGTVDGFRHYVPETAPGPALDAAAARSIAEASAHADWGVDFTPYKLLEQSHLQRPNGRVDHTFVYERTDVMLGEAHIRLQLSVSGDALTEVTRFVHVPEAFGRRFEELRSANNTIARVASLAAGVLYGLGGCIIGVVWLMRRRWLLWKPALVAGAVVAGLNAAAMLANSPQAWFSYDTAQSTAVFWGQQVGIAALMLIGGGLALALVFMAAESLSRKAFPHQPQLWRIWSRDAAPTGAILGRTLGGYLFVPVELALIAGFYFVTNTYYGWWQPSEALSDPNILGSALPALAPIGQALQAGFMEECLFRAVPLSLAAIIGARFGCQRVLIACHAAPRSAGVRLRARQLPWLSGLLAPGRVVRAGADLGTHLSSLRAPADDYSAWVVRPDADVAAGVSGAGSGRELEPRPGRLRRAVSARRRALAARPGRTLAGAGRRVFSMAPGNRLSPARRARRADNARARACGRPGCSARCRCWRWRGSSCSRSAAASRATRRR